MALTDPGLFDEDGNPYEFEWDDEVNLEINDTLEWILDCIRTGYLDAHLLQIGTVAGVRHNTVKALVSSGPPLSPDIKPTNIRRPVTKNNTPAGRVRAAAMGQGRPTVDNGIYLDPDTGEFWRVRPSRQNPGRVYAERIIVLRPAVKQNGVIVEPAKVDFEHEAGKVYKLLPEWRISVADAQRFGVAYGACIRCGKKLTVSTSIERAMGKVCFDAIMGGTS